METGGYIDGFKEAKRLVSEGRAQLESAERIDLSAETSLFAGAYNLFEKKQEMALEKEGIAIEKIMRGLEEYRNLLRYDNTAHFGRIKTAIKYTLDEFSGRIPGNSCEKYRNALFIGPE
ncbi:Uncharacterised protein [uncultured archaeon]|nr:Uncharacterised protein [uncultured archaeon]